MLKRTFTAIVGVTAAFFLIRSGGLIFAAAVLLLAIIGWHEFRVMMLSKGYKVYYLTSGTAVALLNIVPALGYKDTLVPILTAAIISIMLEGLYYHKRGNWAPEVALSSFSVLYVGLLFSHFTMLREVSSSVVNVTGMGSMPLGEVFLWLVLGLVILLLIYLAALLARDLFARLSALKRALREQLPASLVVYLS